MTAVNRRDRPRISPGLRLGGAPVSRRTGLIAALAAGGAALVAFPVVVSAPWMVNIGLFTLMYAALASAWNLVGGYAGYPSLGHAAFFGIGAYTEAIWWTHRSAGSGYGPFWTLPLVGLVAAALAVPVAWIAMRTRADVFAIVTITLLFVVQTLAFNLRGLTGGAQGLAMPVAPFAPDTFERPFYYAMLVLFAAALALSYAVLRSRLGLALVAVRADEDKARGVGVPVTAAKLTAFAVSVAVTAMAGGVWAYYLSFIYPQFAIDPLLSIGMVLMVFLGGRGTLWGPVLGAFVVAPTQQYLAYRFGASQLYLIAYAALFVVIMLLMPRGALPTWTDWRRRRTAGVRT
ncbi:branched-chain amino acid ABC transporter permease [Actinacidiphila oryziradicis]|uniref:Branched-chain amino acid ABC transporter permease n=1 Tax=Actinacidiphila oryziradicis TaxID=2571141 RepID=A0A4U0S6N2_9ACTN|nr:branched-chain amino acid ABC transporter permease [Actinacidiphila oryziradicis]TKA04672.1 branched-chain amino acid ABC transporter permease [Actinacidiphila oryziradicis]